MKYAAKLNWTEKDGVWSAKGVGEWSYRTGHFSDWPYVKYRGVAEHPTLKPHSVQFNTLEKVQAFCQDHHAVMLSIRDEVEIEMVSLRKELTEYHRRDPDYGRTFNSEIPQPKPSAFRKTPQLVENPHRR